MVTVAEILKGRRLAVEKRLTTSLESLSGEYRWVPTPAPAPSAALVEPLARAVGAAPCRTRQKPKMEVLLVKSDVFEEALAKEALRFGTYDSGAPGCPAVRAPTFCRARAERTARRCRDGVRPGERQQRRRRGGRGRGGGARGPAGWPGGQRCAVRGAHARAGRRGGPEACRPIP